MRRLAELEHHKVGNVDNVVDRTNADALDLLAQPLRAWPDRHVVDLADGEKGTFAFRRNPDGAGTLSFRIFMGDFVRSTWRGRHVSIRESSYFARETEMTEQVAAGWRDLDVQARVSRKKIGNRRADFRFWRQD